jgi:hypothetical protein
MSNLQADAGQKINSKKTKELRTNSVDTTNVNVRNVVTERVYSLHVPVVSCRRAERNSSISV